jgi:hypothetical protein
MTGHERGVEGPAGYGQVDAASPAARAALDELVAARARIDRVHADVEGVVATLVAASGIPWSGVAADGWRARVGAARRAAGTGLSDLTELRALLERLEDGIGS